MNGGVITATAPLCPTASLAKPIAIGNTVPPKSPIIIKPETSFFFCGIASNAWEKITGKLFELPKPIRAMQMYIIVFSWKTNNPTLSLIHIYVKSLLSNEFRVLDAADGTEGIRLAMKYVPDVIISDVMMPGMDGVECCRRLKGELQTCHIPVILLTACSLDEQRIQGYDGGADSYISKPFNSQLLLSRVRNLIANRRQSCMYRRGSFCIW